MPASPDPAPEKAKRAGETASKRVDPSYRKIGEQPIAVLSDIHSNLHALERVFTECTKRNIQRFFCLGDIVGYSAFPGECLSVIRRLRCPTVMGNHDERVARGSTATGLNPLARAGADYSVSKLTADQRRWLGELPMSMIIGPVTLVHASVVIPHLWFYVLNEADAEFSMQEQLTPVCFYGHTHHPNLFTARRSPLPLQMDIDFWKLHRNGTYMINPGSVGQPRGGGDPRAQFAIFDPVEFTVEFVRLTYDVAAAADAVRRAGLPEQLASRLEHGR